MIVYIFIRLFVYVSATLYLPEDIEEPKKQLETLDHLLRDAQQKIRESQDLINCLESKDACNATTERPKMIYLGEQQTKNSGYLYSKSPHEIVFDAAEPDNPMVSAYLKPIVTVTTGASQGKPKLLWLTDPPLKPPLAPGDVLFGHLTLATTKDPFEVALNNEMRFEKTGYLSVAFRSLCEQIALKQPSDVQAVLQHTEIILTKMMGEGRLLWLEQPMTNFLTMAAAVVSVLPVDELKSYVVMLQYTMQNRRDSIGSYVNSIIDVADGMVKPNDGEHLFRVIKEFKEFPRGIKTPNPEEPRDQSNKRKNKGYKYESAEDNGPKTGVQLCQEVIEAFERPFLHLLGTSDLRVFVESANKAIKDRFPQLLDIKMKLLRKLSKNPLSLNHQLTQNHGRHEKNKRKNKPLFRSKRSKNVKSKYRRMESDDELVPTRRQIPVNQYYRTTEDANTRRLSNENMNYYKDFTKEDTGIKALLSGNAFKDLSIEDIVGKKTKKSNNKYLQVFSDEFTTSGRYRTTKNGNIRYTLKDGMDEKIYDTEETKQKKRYNVIAPITTRNYRTETSTSRLIIRRTTQTTQPRIDKYKYFNRRTTQVRDYRRKDSKDLRSYNIKKNTTKTEVDATISKYTNEINKTNSRKANGASSSSDEVAALKESLIDQLFLNAEESIATSDNSSSDHN